MSDALPTPIPGRLLTHRSSAIVRFRCYADPRYFLTWADVPEALKDECQHLGWPPCSILVKGEPGLWCRSCRFGETEELAVIAHQRGTDASREKPPLSLEHRVIVLEAQLQSVMAHKRDKETA